MANDLSTIQHIRENIKKELRDKYSEREIDAIADILFCHRLHLEGHEVGLNRHGILSPADQRWFGQALRHLMDGHPVQHVTGRAEFCGLLLDVTPEVLIPRPETEELVHWIVEDLTEPAPVIMDIGTGSGCIALALKKYIPGSCVLAIDVDGSALVMASKNAGRLELDIQFFLHDILTEKPPRGLPTPDIIVSNPPYVPLSEKNALPTHVKDHEPGNALFVPDDNPLLFYDSIASFARHHLKGGGQLYLEIHEKYGLQVMGLMLEKGFSSPELRKDINGKDRMIKSMQP
jgi:release factor glutamine methyltransferase